ncbi:lipoprotein signal peptidase [Anaerotignum neopropionicum]|uniref:Lipoprotein signal peptidase n=1 Tax=Anaerotignum neopropionicum TaxID=36847 RepID=A0A136WD61_9FIRM|nr:signal peptidase II [Anaerotignum neopropionicum]KXL52452.1 lipoprotein signal peptidase [Anaerotignum neopropionicum]
MWFIPAIAMVILIGLDQAAKYFALINLKPIGSTVLAEGILNLTFVENRGVAFGMFSGQRWFILLLTGVITIVLVYYYGKLPKTREYKFVRMAMVLILAGAIGNMIDRVFRGYVVDFFEFGFIRFPVFNVADIFVVVGVFILAFLILFVIKEPEEKKKDE